MCEVDMEICYKCIDYYVFDCDGVVVWNSIGIDWGMMDQLFLFVKDSIVLVLVDFDSLFVYEGFFVYEVCV